MARPRRVICRICDRHIDECGQLSSTGRCSDCGTGNAARQQRQLAEHSGEYFNEWRRAVARSVGAVLPEDLEPDA